MKKIISKIMLTCTVFLGIVTSQAFALTVGINMVDLSNPIYVHSSAYDLNQQNQKIIEASSSHTTEVIQIELVTSQNIS